jgi:hypothetical protein
MRPRPRRHGLRRTGALAVGLLALAPASAGAVSFSGPTDFAAGSGPFSVAVGEFNGNSKPDLAVANSGGDNVSILLGAGGGDFSSPTNFSAPHATSVAVGKFNGDSHPDLAVANLLGNSVSILLGAGGGSFSSPTGFTAGDGPISVAVGEFNGDSHPDLAVANLFGDDVSILLGAGGGSFGAPTNFDAGDQPRSVAVGEFNGDSSPDLAVANEIDGNVSILLGAGGGSFTGPTNFDAGTQPFSVAVGEFDGDSDPDLAVANIGSDNVSILLGAAGGTFTGPTDFSAGSGPGSVAVGEFNGDSNPDLAVANSSSDNVSILLGTGGGSFGDPTNFAAGDLPRSVVVGQFTGGASPDLAIANQASDNVSILLGQAETSISTQATASATPGDPVSDQATLADGVSPTGRITFRLYGRGDPNCSNAPIFKQRVPVSGNGAYQTADFTPSRVGTYRWIATYSGDSDNAQAQTSCNDTDESSTVANPRPNISTTSSADTTLGNPVHDTAHLTGGQSPTGSITFRLYGRNDTNCSNNPAFKDTVSVSGSGDYLSADFTPDRAGTYRWTARYSGDTVNDANATACNDAGESVTVTP